MIIGSQHISTQQELMEEMFKAGISCGQATLSRDLRQLRISKVHTRGGRSAYSLPKEGQFVSVLSREEMKDTQWNVAFSGNAMVVHTPPGYASVVASEMDAAKHAALLGSVAGDDTIIAILAPEAEHEEVATEVARILRKFR